MITMAKIRKMHKSFTIRFNSIAGAFILGLPMLQENLPSLSAYLSAETYRYAMGFVIAANILLRFKTTASLKDK